MCVCVHVCARVHLSARTVVHIGGRTLLYRGRCFVAPAGHHEKIVAFAKYTKVPDQENLHKTDAVELTVEHLEHEGEHDSTRGRLRRDDSEVAVVKRHLERVLRGREVVPQVLQGDRPICGKSPDGKSRGILAVQCCLLIRRMCVASSLEKALHIALSQTSK